MWGRGDITASAERMSTVSVAPSARATMPPSRTFPSSTRVAGQMSLISST